MTVQELIAKLQEFAGDIPVVVIHDERGPDSVRSVSLVTIEGDGGFSGTETVVLVDN